MGSNRIKGVNGSSEEEPRANPVNEALDNLTTIFQVSMDLLFLTRTSTSTSRLRVLFLEFHLQFTLLNCVACVMWSGGEI